MISSRDELLMKLDEIEFWPELKDELEIILNNHISSKDLEVVEALLKAGTSPNPRKDVDCHIHYLLHEYQVERTTKGELILSIMETLLKSGANPNRVSGNNLRAYDYAVSWGISAVVKLLEEYGADKELREPI